MFDVSIFSQMDKTEPSVFFNDSLDITPLKILYDNCVRMGSETNNNVTVATAHPDIWFSDYFELLKSKVKMVVKQPTFQLIKVEDNKLFSTSFSCDTVEFNSDDELKKFFEDISEYGSIALFSIVKYINIKTFNTNWRVRFKDISTKEEIRDKKIGKIIT